MVEVHECDLIKKGDKIPIEIPSNWEGAIDDDKALMILSDICIKYNAFSGLKVFISRYRLKQLYRLLTIDFNVSTEESFLPYNVSSSIIGNEAFYDPPSLCFGADQT